ncbi:hypothetical protein E2320_016305 [Naja naja]|nr:hypothetical protein E2320_016305 [Naja naja]
MSLIISFIVIKEQGREGEKVLCWGRSRQSLVSARKRGRESSMVGQTVDKGQAQRSGGHLRMEGGRGLPCGSCQSGEGGSCSPSMPVSLLLGTSVTVWREAGKNSRAATWKNVSLPPSPGYGNGNRPVSVSVCTSLPEKERTRPFDCSSKPKVPTLLRYTPYSIGCPSRAANWGACQRIYKHLEFYVLWGGAGCRCGGCLIPPGKEQPGLLANVPVQLEREIAKGRRGKGERSHYHGNGTDNPKDGLQAEGDASRSPQPQCSYSLSQRAISRQAVGASSRFSSLTGQKVLQIGKTWLNKDWVCLLLLLLGARGTGGHGKMGHSTCSASLLFEVPW